MRIILSILFCFSLATMGNTQNTANLESAFANGNASQISSYFSSEVEISINREHKKWDQQGGKTHLQSFFSQHRPTAFTNVHKGASGRDATGYLTGDLQTQSGKFRVFVYFEEVNGARKIKEIRMDKI